MKFWFAVGAITAAIGVAMGAFGAHGLKDRLTPDMLAVYDTGARYHLIHALGILAVGTADQAWGGGLVTASGWCLLAGVCLFSGSLYALAITGIKPLGAITPLGGLSFIAGWSLLAIAALRAGT